MDGFHHLRLKLVLNSCFYLQIYRLSCKRSNIKHFLGRFWVYELIDGATKVERS